MGADDGEARTVTDPILDAGYRGMPRHVTMVGGAGAIAEQMRRYLDLGFSDIIVRNLVADQAHAVASIERLAEVKRLLGA